MYITVACASRAQALFAEFRAGGLYLKIKPSFTGPSLLQISLHCIDDGKIASPSFIVTLRRKDIESFKSSLWMLTSPWSCPSYRQCHGKIASPSFVVTLRKKDIESIQGFSLDASLSCMLMTRAGSIQTFAFTWFVQVSVRETNGT